MPVTDDKALFLRTEGEDGVHATCGPPDAIEELGRRFVCARVCHGVLAVACCKSSPGLSCHAEEFRDEDTDRRALLLALALAKAEDNENAATGMAQRMMEAEGEPPARLIAEFLRFIGTEQEINEG